MTTGTGNINQSGVNLPAGSAITYTVTGTISPAATGSIVNTATVTPIVGTAVSAADTDSLANLSITKVDNAGGSSITPSTGNVIPGQTLTYTVVVSNTGTGNVTGASVTDPIPADITIRQLDRHADRRRQRLFAHRHRQHLRHRFAASRQLDHLRDYRHGQCVRRRAP